GNIRLRAVHTAAGVGAVDLYAVGDSNLSLWSDLELGQAGAAAEVPAGAYTIGFDVDNDAVIDLQCGAPFLPAGTVANVFAVNDDGAISLRVQAGPGTLVVIPCSAPPVGATGLVRAIHLAPAVGAVDLFANGAGPVATLSYQESTGYVSIAAGANTFSLSPTGQGADASVFGFDADIPTDAVVTAAVIAGPNGLEALTLLDDTSGIADTFLRSRIVHVSSGVGPIEVFAVLPSGAEISVIKDLGFGTASAALTGPNNPVALGIDATQDGEVDFVCAPVLAPSGTLVNVFVAPQGSGIALVAQTAAGSVMFPCSATGEPTSDVRVVHLSPNAPSVDVFANGAGPVVSDLPFGDGTGYLTVPAGTYTFDVVVSGDPVDAAVLTVPNLALDANVQYTAVAYNTVDAIAALALVDDTSAPAAGNIRLRAIHTAAGVGTVDLYAVGSDGSATPLWSDLDFGAAGDALDVPSAAYTVGIDVDNDAAVDLECAVPLLAAGTVANVFAVNDDGAISLRAQLGAGTLVTISCGPPVVAGQAELRVLHLAPDAPAVDVYVSDTIAVAGASFLEGSGYLPVSSGLTGVAVTPGGSNQAVIDVDLTLLPDTRTTVVAFGPIDGLEAIAITDASAPAADVARIRAAHLALGVGTVDVRLVGGPALFTGVAFGGVSDPIDVAPGSYRVGLDLDGDGTTELSAQLPELTGGTVANIFAVTDSEGLASLVVQLPDGSTFNAPLLPFDAPNHALVRILNVAAAPNAGLTISADGATSFSVDLDPFEASEYLSLPAGEYDVNASGGGIFGGLQTSGTGAIEAGLAYTLILYNGAGLFGSTLQLGLLLDNSSALPGAASQLRASHFVADLDSVSVTLEAPILVDLTPDISFGEVTDWSITPAGPTSVRVQIGGGGEVFYELDAIAPGRTTQALLASTADGDVRLITINQSGASVNSAQ
ncbi:MAG: hypothetical protein ACI9OJ_005493, partial [Myxococcota bacterium]